jgi:integrase
VAVVSRKRRSGTVVYFVQNEWQGKQASERSGTSKRQAEVDDRAMKKAIKDGTYVPKTGLRATTVRQECELLVKSIDGPGAKINADRLRLYVLSRPWLADMRASQVGSEHIDQLVAELKRETKPDGSRRISNQTVINALAALRFVFSRAIKGKRCTDQPVEIKAYRLGGASREKVPYSLAEVTVLTRHHAIRWPTRVLNALVLFTGMREGEASGRRWRDLSDARPLACLSIHDQYDGQPLKTKRPRKAPVHPELARSLAEWATEGFELYTGHKPRPGDFIVPCIGRDGTEKVYSKRAFYEAFVRGCKVSGVQPRTLHATRHTFITLCRRANCNTEKLAEITHNAKGNIVDQYTHRDWSELCEVVLCLKLEKLDDLDAHQTAHFVDKNALLLGGGGQVKTDVFDENSRQFVISPRSPASGTNLPFEQQNGQFENTRQESRQDFSVNLGELREANRRRKRDLLLLQRIDPTAAKPGLFLTRALDSAYSGDLAELDSNLAAAAKAIGGAR